MAKDKRYQAFWDAIERRVCTICLDQKNDGNCGLSGRVCAIEKHLPGVVAALIAVESDRMDEYVAAIESQICGKCPEQSPQGACGTRAKGDCALYTYLHLIVDAVQDVREGTAQPSAPVRPRTGF